jgi:hypothetical protein
MNASVATSRPMTIYCTLFDRNYISRGLALHASLLRQCPRFKLAILCLDEVTQTVLESLALAHVDLMSLSALEAIDPDLLRAKSNRTKVEYYFTCKPALMRYLLGRYNDRITYLDSDLFYFSDPSLLEQEYAPGSVALTPHRFPARLAERTQFGRFNAGWVSANGSVEGRRFVEWWRERCIEWCRMEVQGTRFADQKYLDQVPDLFSDVAILGNAGANLAPWNLDGLNIERSSRSILVEGAPLYFFHFHGVKKVLGPLYDSGLDGYEVRLSRTIRRNIYSPYLAELANAETLVRRSGGHRVQTGPAFTPRDALRRFKRAAHLVAGGTCVIGP